VATDLARVEILREDLDTYNSTAINLSLCWGAIPITSNSQIDVMLIDANYEYRGYVSLINSLLLTQDDKNSSRLTCMPYQGIGFWEIGNNFEVG
jgi:hypothetical protein